MDFKQWTLRNLRYHQFGYNMELTTGKAFSGKRSTPMVAFSTSTPKLQQRSNRPTEINHYHDWVHHGCALPPVAERQPDGFQDVPCEGKAEGLTRTVLRFAAKHG